MILLKRKWKKCMQLCNHTLYQSEVYTKPEGTSSTFVKMMDVSSYLHKRLVNELLRDELIHHFPTVERILAHPACEIILQIKFDVNLIEVSNGYCFKSRKFIKCPIPESMKGKQSPRSFVPDCSTLPDQGTFAKVSSILLPKTTSERALITLPPITCPILVKTTIMYSGALKSLQQSRCPKH